MSGDDFDWNDEYTEPILGLLSANSLQIDLRGEPVATGMSASPVDLANLWQTPTKPPEKDSPQPDVLVFDPLQFGLVDALHKAGFDVRTSMSAVEVMNEVATRLPALVLCGPSDDAERRRMLTAALKVRFPSVPVVYASTHAGSEAAQKGARKEGACAMFPLPLTSSLALVNTLSTWLHPNSANDVVVGTPISEKKEPCKTNTHADAPSIPYEFNDENNENDDFGFDNEVTATLDAKAVRARNEQGSQATERSYSPHKPERLTSSQKEAQQEGALSPFLWGLDEAKQWLEQKAREGHQEAVAHARTLASISQLLEQLADKQADK